MELGQAQTIQLQEGIKSLQERIREEVHRRQDELLRQAESLREAQSFMQVMPCIAPATFSLNCQISGILQEANGQLLTQMCRTFSHMHAEDCSVM